MSALCADILHFSPTKAGADSAERMCHDDLPCLRLEKFNTAPKLDFGYCVAGEARVLQLRVENLTSDAHTLEIEKPKTSTLGFSLEDVHFEIRAANNVYINVHWTAPTEYEIGVEGRSFREVFLLKWNGKHRLSFTVQGCAILPPLQKKKLANALKPLASAPSNAATRLKLKSTEQQENRVPLDKLAAATAAVNKVGPLVTVAARAPLAPKSLNTGKPAAPKSAAVDTDLLDALYDAPKEGALNCSTLHVDASFFGGLGGDLNQSSLAVEPDAWSAPTPRAPTAFTSASAFTAAPSPAPAYTGRASLSAPSSPVKHAPSVCGARDDSCLRAPAAATATSNVAAVAKAVKAFASSHRRRLEDDDDDSVNAGMQARATKSVLTYDMRSSAVGASRVAAKPSKSTSASTTAATASLSSSTLSTATSGDTGASASAAVAHASRHMFFDERWAEKQERAFTRWLNFLLDPELNAAPTTTTTTTSTNLGASSLASSSAHAMPMLALSARLADAAHRRDALAVYRAPASALVVARLEQEVESGRLALRTDVSERHFHADVGMRAETVRAYFASVHPAWLRLALETVLGAPMPYADAAQYALHADNAHVRALVQRWLLARVWASAELEAEYSTNLGVANSYREGYWAALGKYSLKRVLQLWWCLEQIKRARCLGDVDDPRLFAVDAPFKSLADCAQDFAKRHLRGEANLARHLQHLGCALTHRQSPLDELALGVRSLAVDLRDGVRLARVAELMLAMKRAPAPASALASATASASAVAGGVVMRQLRLPSDSRLRKVHNVAVALTALRAADVPLPEAVCSADDVIDGHRERTLELLWRTMLHWQSAQADVEDGGAATGDASIAALAREVRTLRRNADAMRRSACHRFHLVPLFPTTANNATHDASNQAGAAVAAAAHSIGDPTAVHPAPPALSATFVAASGGALDEARIAWLGRWVAAVCARFPSSSTASSTASSSHSSLPIANWSTAFADGRALLLLLHFYAPHVVARDEIGDATSVALVHEAAFGSGAGHNALARSALGDSTSDARAADGQLASMMHALALGGSTSIDERKMARALDVDRRNIRLFLQRAYRHLGQMPPLLHEGDLYNAVPDERVVITFVSLLARRLLAVNREEQAVCCIQQHYRRYRERKNIRTMAVVHVQAHARALLSSAAFQSARANVMDMQARIAFHHRVARVRAAYGAARAAAAAEAARRCAAALILQRAWRGRCARRVARTFRAHVACAVECARTCVARGAFERQRALVVATQARVRGWLVRRGFAYWNACATKIQAAFRGWAARRRTQGVCAAIARAQGAALAVVVAHRFIIARAALERTQAHAHCVLRVAEFQRAQCAAITLQAHTRRWCAQRRARELRYARFVHLVVVAQAAVRRWAAQRQLRALQARERARIEAARRQAAALSLQAHFRRLQAQRTLMQLRVAYQRNRAALTLQSNFRRLQAQRTLTTLRVAYQRNQAALALQSHWRRLQALRALAKLRIAYQRNQAALQLQAHWRRLQAQRTLAALRVAYQRNAAAVMLQSHYRRVRAQRTLVALRTVFQRQCAAVVLQSHWRRLQAQRQLAAARADYAAWCAEQERVARLRAALRLQCAYRARCARQRVAELRAARLLAQQRCAVAVVERLRCGVLQRRSFLAHCRAKRALAAVRAAHAHTVVAVLGSAAAVSLHITACAQHAVATVARLRTAVAAQLARHCAARSIQAVACGWLARVRARRVRAAIACAQAAARVCTERAKMATIIAARAREAELGAALRFIQLRFRFARSWRAKRAAAAVAQAAHAAHTAAALFVRQRRAAVLMQSWVRGHLARRALVAPTPVVASLASTTGTVAATSSTAHSVPHTAAAKTIASLSSARAAVAPCASAAARLNVRAKYASAPVAPWTASTSTSTSAAASATESQQFARKVAALRRRWRTNSQWRLAAPEARLGHQTAAALDTLLNAKQLAPMHAAAKRLEATTRLSLAACAEAVEAGIVPVLLRLMAAANRSAPYIELVRCCQRVLVHLIDNAATAVASKHSQAVAAACEAAAFGCAATQRCTAELLVEQLMVHRERDDMCAAVARLLRAGCERHADFAAVLRGDAELLRRMRGALAMMEKRAAAGAVGALADLRRAVAVLV